VPKRTIPQPPFLGSRVVDRIPLNNVFEFVNETALFKGQWQFKQEENRTK
jgi:5-methyltetrahydrofolate--homocysteine methyltransferase